VFFDDFEVVHTKGPVVQSEEYYPFGLTFNSYQKENSVGQNLKFYSKEEQDELGLGWLDFGRRMYQPELGRFMVHDRYTEKFLTLSPYQYAANNPLSFVDVSGDSIVAVTRNGNDIMIENSPAKEGGENFTNTIALESDVAQDNVSDYSAGILNDAMIAIGDNSIGISSGARTPEQQADAMYSNIVNGSVAGEKQTYGPGGDAVIDVYVDMQPKTDKQGYTYNAHTPGETKAAMTEKIKEDPGKVSNHTVANPKTFNVFDVKPSTVSNTTKMHNTLNADSRVDRVLSKVNKPSEKAIHVEITQPKKK
jgi:RHS repeat-associated protein